MITLGSILLICLTVAYCARVIGEIDARRDRLSALVLRETERAQEWRTKAEADLNRSQAAAQLATDLAEKLRRVEGRLTGLEMQKGGMR